jgi:two-component system sensor histidine kinase FlrB
MEQAPRTQENSLADLYAEILDALPVGLVLLTNDGKVIEANPKAAQILGFIPRGDFFANKIETLSLTGNGQSTAEMHLTEGARRIFIQESKTESGLRLLAIEDITEQSIKDVQASEERKMAAIGAVAARMAHQMRTPLTSALLNAGLAQKHATDTASKNRISSLISQLGTLEARISALLRYTKGQQAPQDHFYLSQALEAAITQTQPMLEENGITVSVNDQSNSKVHGPKEDCICALIAILENSIESGSKKIDILITDEGDQCQVQIQDNGSGAGEKKSLRYEDPFVTTKQHGNGLGLAIASETAKACGGSLKAEPNKTGFFVQYSGKIV